jgi:hypothetical protein
LEDIRNLERWLLEDHIGAISPSERNYITYHDDLIAVEPKSRSWFRGILETRNLLWYIPWFT